MPSLNTLNECDLLEKPQTITDSDKLVKNTPLIYTMKY